MFAPKKPGFAHPCTVPVHKETRWHPLFSIKMAFENQNIWHPTYFGPFKYQISSLFRSHCTKLGRFILSRKRSKY